MIFAVVAGDGSLDSADLMGQECVRWKYEKKTPNLLMVVGLLGLGEVLGE